MSNATIVDFSTHFFPRAYLEGLRKMKGGASEAPPVRLAAVNPGLSVLEERLAVVDEFAERRYRQVLSVPPVGIGALNLPKAAMIELAGATNRELKELVDDHPDQFVAALGFVPPDSSEIGAQAISDIVELGLPGVLLPASCGGAPLDVSPGIEVLEEALRRDLTVFLHPARTPAVPDFGAEAESRFSLWQVIGWTYESTALLIRLALRGIFRRHPGARIVAHHLGGLIPFYGERIRSLYEIYGVDNPSGESAADREAEGDASLIGDIDLIYADTAVVSVPALRCGLETLGPGRLIFGSDAPMDGEGGRRFIRLALAGVDAAVPDPCQRDSILHRTAQASLLNTT